MAIFIEDGTLCSLCGKTIKDGENAYALPAFVANAKDPLYFFNDSVFHKKCLLENSFGQKAIDLSEIFMERIRPENRICIVGKTKIKNIEDYVFIDLLTSETQEPLYRYNFLTFDKHNIFLWKEREQFLETVEQFIKDDKWRDSSSFDYLDNLLKPFYPR